MKNTTKVGCRDSRVWTSAEVPVPETVMTLILGGHLCAHLSVELIIRSLRRS